MGPVRAAFEQLMRHVELGTAIILIVGPGGSGKTFLLDIAEEACRTRGISVLRIERGDLAHTVIGKHVDLLLVDEADFVDQATLNFIAGHPETAKTVVFACRTPCSVGDMAAPTLVNLTPLTASEARDFLVERATAAGRPDLFAPDALDSLVAGTLGLPRLLRSVGALALFLAAHEGASRVCMEHVADALDTQSGKGGLLDEKGRAKPRPANVSVSPIAHMAAEPEIAREPAPLMAAAAAIGDISSAQAAITTPSDKPESPHGRFMGARILGAALFPLLLLSGSHGQAGTATQVSATMNLVHRASAMNALRALERVAEAERPGSVILVVLNPPPLQPLQIAQAERTFAAVKKPVTPALPPKKTRAKNPPRANITQR